MRLQVNHQIIKDRNPPKTETYCNVNHVYLVTLTFTILKRLMFISPATTIGFYIRPATTSHHNIPPPRYFLGTQQT